MGGQVMARASSQTIRIMIRANRFERRLREYVSGLVTAKYLSDGWECQDLRFGELDINICNIHKGRLFSPVHADGAQAENRGRAEEHVEGDPNVAEHPAQLPRACNQDSKLKTFASRSERTST